MPQKLRQKAKRRSYDYDYASALEAGLWPGKSGHWPSRVPSGKKEGLLLKSVKHPTFHKTVKVERELGNRIVRKNKRWYSLTPRQLQKEQRGRARGEY